MTIQSSHGKRGGAKEAGIRFASVHAVFVTQNTRMKGLRANFMD